MNMYAVVLVRVVWLFFYMSCACSLERIQSGAALYAFMLSKWPPIPCVVEKEDLTLVHLATATCYIFQICSCVLSKTTAHKVLKIIVAPKWLDLPNGVTMCYYYFFLWGFCNPPLLCVTSVTSKKKGYLSFKSHNSFSKKFRGVYHLKLFPFLFSKFDDPYTSNGACLYLKTVVLLLPTINPRVWLCLKIRKMQPTLLTLRVVCPQGACFYLQRLLNSVSNVREKSSLLMVP